MAAPIDDGLARYPHALRIPTRWMDNDNYGHVNNVTYYSYVDTVVNAYLIDEGGLDIHEGAVIGVVAETGCTFHDALSFPDVVVAGLRVAHLGTSSARYEIGLFQAGVEDAPAATAHFVHVFVDRTTRRPTPIPDGLRTALVRIQIEG